MRIAKKKMILAKDLYYDMDSVKSGVNNNVLVVGSPGSRKTRSIVTPNILQGEGSYVVTDPKGNLYDQYGEYLRSLGYDVKRLDFVNPEKSAHYNPLAYIKNDQDITKLATILASPQISGKYQAKADPFWEQTAVLVLSAAIGYLKEKVREDEQTIQNMFELLEMADPAGDSANANSKLMKIFERHEKISKVEGKGIPFSVKQFNKVKNLPSKTFLCTLGTVFGDIGMLDTNQMKKMMSRDDIDIPSIGKKKTAVFVVVSDTDRSMDKLANLFFTQAMNELCFYADTACKSNRLPLDVRFIMDDFATNCKIDEFPRMISSIRSRGMSAVLILQAESQLLNAYGYDGKTIIGCCDSYVYMGGNDLDTAKAVSERCDEPLSNILTLPIEECIVFRRGEKPVHGKVFPLEKLTSYQRALDMCGPIKTPKICVEEPEGKKLSFKESTTIQQKHQDKEPLDMLSSDVFF